MLSTTDRAVEAGLSLFNRIPVILRFIGLILAGFFLIARVLAPIVWGIEPLTRASIGLSMVIIGLIIARRPQFADLRPAYKVLAFALIILGMLMVDATIQDVGGVSHVYFDP